jgi:glucose-1-phosphate cytidylyltransferase
MQTIILAGGFGTRISEESHSKPKPMIDIGEKPILWHIMKIYSHFGFSDFVICLGYKGYQIKSYFANYFLHESDVTFNFSSGDQPKIHSHSAEPWKVTLIDTGLNTMTGSRVKKVSKFLRNETFMLTYGDGVSDVNIPELLKFHKSHGKLATVTAVQPGGRFGALDLRETGNVAGFQEKPQGEGGWINGGFFVFEPAVLDYISPHSDSIVLERQPLENLAKDNQLMAYKHHGFWQPMDTLRDKTQLDSMWTNQSAPWKLWS